MTCGPQRGGCGHLHEPEIVTGIGPVAVRLPRSRPRQRSLRIHFLSAILPPMRVCRRAWRWCLQFLSTGAFDEALVALFGKDAGGLSASTIGRLEDAWSDEYLRWSKRDLRGRGRWL